MSKPINEITKERLSRWAEKCEETQSTPVILITVGHNKNSGQIGLITTEDMDDKLIKAFLKSIQNSLK